MNARNSSKISSRTTGSRPEVASSRISRRGLAAKAAARDSFIFMPLEKVLTSFLLVRPNFSR